MSSLYFSVRGCASLCGDDIKPINSALAQCCPDIGLLPMLADIFEISIDELFGRKNEKEIHYDLCSELPWNDDNTIRVFRT